MSSRFEEVSMPEGLLLLGATNGAHFATRATSEIEEIAAVTFQASDEDALGHDEALQSLAGVQIDAADVALLVLPMAMPQVAVDPGDTRHVARRWNDAEHAPRFGVDLVDAWLTELGDPERAFCPGQAAVAPLARRRKRREHR